MRGEKKKNLNPLLSFLSSHSLPSNHPALKHDSSVSRCLCSLCPSLLIAFFRCFGPAPSPLSLTAPHVLLMDAAGRVKEEERDERRERENCCDTGTHGGCIKLLGRGNVQCTDVESVQGEKHELAALFTPDTPKLLPILRVLHL